MQGVAIPSQTVKLAVDGIQANGAGEGNRTLVTGLEDRRSTIELRPRPCTGFVTDPRLAVQAIASPIWPLSGRTWGKSSGRQLSRQCDCRLHASRIRNSLACDVIGGPVVG